MPAAEVRELRRSPRISVHRLRIGLAEADLALHGNLSTGGVGFELSPRHRARVGDPIAVQIDVPELSEPLALSATICHVQRRAGSPNRYVGARFGEIDELIENPLYRYVEETALLGPAVPR